MRALLPCLLLTLAACAAPGAPQTGIAAAAPAGRPSPLAVVQGFREELPFLRRADAPVDYEAAGRPGLGASVRYVGIRGLPGHATVYVYDRGLTLTVEGADNPQALQELENSAAELIAFANTGRLRDLSSVTAQVNGGPPSQILTGGPASGPGSTRCRALAGTLTETGVRVGEAVCVTVRDGRFVKTRVTLRDRATVAFMIASNLITEVLPPAKTL
ncbi:hypothetical protein [Roseomonas sp. 18066]|uniref:hypothetical protein n=1 Tax=Roseomonas sp. 18066 TaxID=2681412 RepID=UPI001357D702|nr:hypothetical protein [Roseomonas sp. 18066]